MVVVMYWFFGTEIGSALRATGNNEDMIRALGVNTKWTKLLALMLSNGLVGMSGAVYSQYMGYTDVTAGSGTVVSGFAPSSSVRRCSITLTTGQRGAGLPDR